MQAATWQHSVGRFYKRVEEPVLQESGGAGSTRERRSWFYKRAEELVLQESGGAGSTRERS